MTTRTLRLTPADRQHLVVGAAALGIVLDQGVVAQFARYADLLDLWSPKVNLLSCGSAIELVERHFLDSLAVAAVLPESGRVVDLGTGAGLPGVPLAILRPEQQFVLVEVRRRRATFIREVRRTLGLSNVEVLEQRAETPPSTQVGKAKAVVTRAVWSDDALSGGGSQSDGPRPPVLLEICARWLSPTGRLFWMRSDPLPETPLQSQRETVQYQIGRGRLRTIEVLGFEGTC